MAEPLPTDFRYKLAIGKYSNWARDLDYDQLEVILWMLGEIYIRKRVEMTTALKAYFDNSSQESVSSLANGTQLHFPSTSLISRQSIASAMLSEFVYSSRKTNIDNATCRMHLYEQLIERIEEGETVDLEVECNKIESSC